jgi:hypothetical protein
MIMQVLPSKHPGILDLTSLLQKDAKTKNHEFQIFVKHIKLVFKGEIHFLMASFLPYRDEKIQAKDAKNPLKSARATSPYSKQKRIGHLLSSALVPRDRPALCRVHKSNATVLFKKKASNFGDSVKVSRDKSQQPIIRASAINGIHLVMSAINSD